MLDGLPLVDHHAHPVLRPEHARGLRYSAFFTEGPDTEAAGTTLGYLRSRREVAELLECDPDEVEEARERLGLDEVARRALQPVDTVLLDDGLTLGRTLPLEWHARHTKVHRILRLESTAEELAGPPFDDFVAAFDAQLQGALAFKTIAAYRGGLRTGAPTHQEAALSYARFTERAERRLQADRPLLEWLLRRALQHGKPVQVHTGFGDPDLDLREADPLHLRNLLEEFPRTPLVLLHVWPFARHAAYLASVYPNAYADFGLAVPLLSQAGMRSTVTQLLEAAPTARVLYSSDASRIPELFWLGARWGRRVLAEALQELDPRQAEAAAARILAANARELYGL